MKAEAIYGLVRRERIIAIVRGVGPEQIDDVDFVAVGGVRPDNIADFFRAGCVAIAIGGSIIKKEFVEQSNWQAITNGTREYVEILAGL